jgi:AcrR family transcriptional regulator
MPAVKQRVRKTRGVDDARLTRARITKAGLTLLAEHGADGLNMRALADALGTAPMSLYRHVRSKDDLLKAIVAMVLERHDFKLPARGAWTERVASWMHALRKQLLRSPAVVSILMQHGHYAPALLRATSVLLRLLREAGFAGPDAVRASREIMWSTLGFVSAEIRGPAFSPSFYAQALHEQAEDGADVSEVAAHLPYMRTRDLDDVFAAIVRHLLAGLAAEVGERAVPARRSSRA